MLGNRWRGSELTNTHSDTGCLQSAELSHYRSDMRCETGNQSHIHTNTYSRPNCYACSNSDSASNTNGHSDR